MRKSLSERPARVMVALALIAGLLIGLLFLTPAGAHVTRSVRHLVNKHLKRVFYTKAEANARFYTKDDADARFATRLWAVVNSNATLARGNGVTSVGRGIQFAGQYDVIFNRNVRDCAYVATPGQPGTDILFDPTFISVSSDPDNPNGVRVETKNPGGGLTDEPFHLHVVC
jgi:hypothetical protein